MASILLKETDYFDLYQISNGVYAGIENDRRLAGNNAAFVDMGDYTIVFDSFLNIDASKELKRAAEEFTGKPIRYVINSHYHMDHVLGNCVFEPATAILSSKVVREKILSESVKSMEEIRGLDKKVLLDMEEEMKNTIDEDTREQIMNDYKLLSNVMREDAALRAPELVFEGSMTLYGSNGRAELIAFDKAHSPQDVILYLPEHKVCFTGDLLFSKMHPWMGTGVPENYLKALTALLYLDVEVFVPGHGDLSTEVDIKLQMKYINELLSLTDKAKQAGDTEPKFTLSDISEVFRNWDGLCFNWNIDFLMERDNTGR